MQPKDLNQLNKSLKVAFSKIKEELDMHLTSINDNTEEIAANVAYMTELDTKIEKLNEKMDEITMMLSQLPKETKAFLTKPLTINEKQVLMAIYSSSKPISYTRIAQNLNLTESVVKSYVESIIAKKIPVIISFINTVPHLSLDDEFRDKQAKENIIGVEQKFLNDSF